jgi:hypothetical protein
MLIGFIIGGFIFFITAIYFVVLILFPEWVGVSGRDHQRFMDEQKGDATPVSSPKGNTENSPEKPSEKP